MRDADDSLVELRAALRADAAGVAEALLGTPNKAFSTKNTLRWGGKGSLSLEIHGPNKGLWFSHEGSEGSDLLGLVQHVQGSKFPEALAWARHWTGLEADDAAPYQPRPRATPVPDPGERAEADAELAERIATARRIAALAVPATAGDPADWYLRQTRGIPRPAGGWPDAIRWHHGYRALVAVATTADGTVQAVQRIHLGLDGNKVGADEMQARHLRAAKITNGVGDGAAVRLPGDQAGPLLLAEGPETGLAAWASTGHETWVALGAVGKLQPPAGRQVLVLSDDNPPARDPKQGAAAKALLRALSRWRKAGISALVATPWTVRRWDKSDMADVILAHGPAVVLERIQGVLAPASAATPRLMLADAERKVAQAVGAFFARVDELSAARVEWDKQAAAAMAGSLPVVGGDGPKGVEQPSIPPADAEPTPMAADDWAAVFDTPVERTEPATFTHGVRVDVGVGKSHAAREEVGRVLAAMRARGDARTIIIAVPDHALGEQQAESWQALSSVQAAGLRVAAWRGRSAPDPAAPGYADADVPKAAKVPMCGDLERVHDAMAVALSADEAACKRRVKGADGKKRVMKCPLYDTCAYQAQRDLKADLWLVAHSSLFHKKPAAVGEVAAVVVDEAAWRNGLVGAEGRHIMLTLDELASDDLGALTGNLRDRLADLRRQLGGVLAGIADGPVQRAAFQASNLAFQAGNLAFASAAEAFKLEWERRVDGLHPGQSREERRAAMAALEGNKSISRCAMAWTALRALLTPGGPEASGWMALGMERTRDGQARVLRLKGRQDVADGWKAPTLLLDALLPVELVRPFWPDVELVADVRAAMPHQHVHQVTDKAYAASMLAPLGEEAAKNDPKAAQRRLNRLRDLRATLVREARRWAPGQVLVVAQKAVKEALLELRGLPGNVTLAHHNAVAGRDEWRDAAAVVVVGRTQAPPSAVERIAEALTGRAVPALGGWYERADAAREMANGTSLQADADRHPDPLAELIRWQVCEGQVVQIIGRGRGVRRTADNPVHVLVLTDVPLPMPLAGTLDAAEMEPGPSDLMLAEGGMVFENARHAASAYPDLWSAHTAAAKALERGRSRTFPYRDTLIRKCPTPRQEAGDLVEVAYQVAGAGQKPAKAWADLLLCADPAAFLALRLGRLAWCKVEGPTPPEPEPPVPDPPPPEPPSHCDPAAPPGQSAWDHSPPGEPDSLEPAGEPDLGEFVGVADVLAASASPAPVIPMIHASELEVALMPYLSCDVPALHPEVAAYPAPGGGMTISCPYCEKLHLHGGTGHRLAHCDDPRCRGYVLVPASAAPPWVVPRAPVAAPDRELRR